MKKRKKKFSAPAWWLYYPAAVIVSLYMRVRYRVSVDKSGIKGIKGPALVLANHLSNFDHFLVGMALLPHRPTFVLSAHFMMNPFLRPILKALHVITKRMFDSDAGTVLNMMRAARDGRIVVLFPEGRLTWVPHSMRITEGTAELIKKLKIDVYRVTPSGAFLTFPKWGRSPRRGKIKIETEKLISASDIPSMSKDDIYSLISDKLRHDDEAACEGIKFSCRDTTGGLDGILYKCPVCGSKSSLSTHKSHISCSDCGFETKLDQEYKFTDAPYKTINEWYNWQYASLDLDAPLTGDASVSASDKDGNIAKGAGHGHIFLDREHFIFDGELFSEHVRFEIPSESIISVPITVSKRFDIYHNGTLLQFTPTPDPRETVRWAIYFDRLADERLGAAGK